MRGAGAGRVWLDLRTEVGDHARMRMWLLLVAAVAGTACVSTRVERKTQPVTVSTEPPGASVWIEEGASRRDVGVAPVTVEAHYDEEVSEFSGWWWLWPAASVVFVPLAFTDQGNSYGGPFFAGGIAMTTLGLGWCIAGLMLEGQRPIPRSVKVGGSHEGRLPAEQTITVPGLADLRLALPPEAVAAVTPPPAKAPEKPAPEKQAPEKAPPPKPQAAEKPAAPKLQAAAEPQPKTSPASLAGVVVAVFDIQDVAGAFEPKIMDQLTEYLASRLAEVTRARIVPREQLRARLREDKKESYSACYDESCQIELGNAVAAQKSLSSKVLRFGDDCRITLDLYDLRSETSEGASTVRTTCTPNALASGVDQLVDQLRAAR